MARPARDAGLPRAADRSVDYLALVIFGAGA